MVVAALPVCFHTVQICAVSEVGRPYIHLGLC